ncbi:MAG: MBOAT family O-acyltransferase [Acetobacteraceae bacterium]|nr:MBOAT family O-acyltransferase [Acetobacteraceae bacterium]
MLFNSVTFLFGFLPIALGGYFATARFGRRVASVWLVAASLVFYGWLNPAFVPLLAASTGFNFCTARLLAATRSRPAVQRWVLRAGVAVNLGALVYYKYLGWLVGLGDSWGLLHTSVPAIVLPLGISFFTFTQIGYLMDVRDGTTEDRSLLNYAVFVTFFPHLIAGPILHNRDIMPQFADPATCRFLARNLGIGLSIFILGLLKKTLLADPTAVGVAEAFARPDTLPLFAAWHAVLCYSLQLYFDFSGYSDMAIGLARMFNVRFPLNFNSPYKAQSVIDYWQRWHMTLTRYLTQYVYTPLALWVMRRRLARRLKVNHAAQTTTGGFAAMIALPVFVTIGLAGIWHGSGAQFLVFGLLHAAYLTTNRAWRLHHPPVARLGGRSVLWRVTLTYLCVLVGAVFFRAPSVPAALSMLGGMAGRHGIGPALPVLAWVPGHLPGAAWLQALGMIQVTDRHTTVQAGRDVLWLVALYAIIWGAPNTQQIFIRFAPALEAVEPGLPAWLRWQPSPIWAVAFGCLGMLGLLALGGTGEFLYFQF